MPSPLTSSFASAAAGSNSENAGARRGDNANNNEWSRNRANGATQTFRRPSLATTPSQTREGSQLLPSAGSAGIYIPPHLNANYQTGSGRNGVSGEARYSKDQLLGIFQGLKDSGGLNKNLEDLFLGSWDPLDPRNDSNASWQSKELKDTTSGPEVCWDYQTGGAPLGLTEMNDEEKSLFSLSVNSPLKLPQGNAKENAGGGGSISGRKPSVSGHHLGTFGPAATPTSRPGPRRRETSDSFSASGPLSPTGSKPIFRDETPTATPTSTLLRRKTELNQEFPQSLDDSKDRDVNVQELGPELDTAFASLKRSTTVPINSGLNGPSSPWSAGPQSSAFGSMGTFGSFAIGSSPLTQESVEKRPGFGSARGGSRFKDLLTKTSAEEMSPSIKQKISMGNLEKLPEDEAEGGQSKLTEIFKTRPNRSETNPYEDAPLPRSGSAALGGAQDMMGTNQTISSAFGLPANVGGRDFMQRDMVPDSTYHQTPQSRYNSQEIMSPTNTNPYQSPPGNRGDDDDLDTNDSESQQSGLPPFGTIRRNMISASDDRNQSSATMSTRGLPGLGGLPSLSGGLPWATTGIGPGAPGRERANVSSAFGDPIFSPMSDLQSPNLGSLGGSNFFGSTALNGTNSIGRTSKLGALFPPAMQEQMRGDSSRNENAGNTFAFDSKNDGSQQPTRDPFESNARRRDEPPYRGSFFDENSLSRMSEDNSMPFSPQAPFSQSSTTAHIPITASGSTQRMSTATDTTGISHGLSQSSGSSSSNQLPAAQQRQMVMPDRMRWIYRDPQGNTQGPWSGLEMHDWFKAGFFTAELQVKKVEDTEYEPLAQLVRRIGNSREPFLVPQIGVPHGPATSTQGNHWASPTVPGAGPAQTGSAQPPFASSFPSFGTTLTAEQQNALERRKQEEQFLMARQKEHLAQQQVMMKQIHLQNGPHAMHSLQHHSSAHSLHSQPSFGSITSPSGYQPSPLQGPIQPPQNVPSFLDSIVRQPPTSNMGPPISGGDVRGTRDDDLHNLVDRMSFSQRAMFPTGSGPLGSQPPDNMAPSHHGNAILQERARLQAEQQQSDMRSHREAFLGQNGQNDRLSEFQTLRMQPEFDPGNQVLDGLPPQPVGAPQRTFEDQVPRQPTFGPPGAIGQPGLSMKQSSLQAESEDLSLTQQVQRTAASTQHQPIAALESVWNKVEITSSVLAPPPLSISPLPAPAAQRNRPNVADSLVPDSRSASQTPIDSANTSIAPWADKSIEVTRGPSLKEIQEAEARKAAQQDEIVAAARRAQAEQERLVQLPPPAPGLPATSTWGSSVSPATPSTPAASVWAKTSAGKPATVAANGTTKKTLAQIQKEEESRKQRAAAAAIAQAASTMPSTAGGKRYAELASKIAPTTPVTSIGAWTTVGSSGKAKAPATVVATPQAPIRSASNAAPAARPRPVLQTARSTTLSNQSKASDEFTKWTKAALGKGLNNNINLEDFVQSLLALPPEIEIISDSVYANSQTLDGRRFAEEFVRRRKLADKGIVDPANSGTPPSAGNDSKSAGGWSEVAKKGPAPKEESNTPFKVVSKKKGKR